MGVSVRLSRHRRSAPSRGAARGALVELGELQVHPRHFFVADLERRLAAVMDESIRGDLVPADVELLPPRRRHQPRPFIVSVALVVAVLALAGGALAGRTPTQELGTAAGAASSADGAGDERLMASDAPASAAGDATSRSRGRADDQRRAAGVGRTRDGGTRPDAGPARPANGDATSAAGPTSVRPQARAVAPLRLEAWGTQARVVLDWSRYEGDDFAAYLVLRAASPDEPAYPDPTGRTIMLLRIENRDMTHHEDVPKVGTTPRYRVVAVNAAGELLASSGAVTPTPTVTPRPVTRLPSASGGRIDVAHG